MSSSIKAAHVDKSTEKQIATVMVARSEETPTASVRPTNIVGMLQTKKERRMDQNVMIFSDFIYSRWEGMCVVHPQYPPLVVACLILYIV